MKIAAIDNCAMAEFEDAITSVVFFCGCDMDCKYCQNPHLISSEECDDIEWQDLVDKIEWDVVDWLSLTGGEPLYSVTLGEEGDQLVSLLSFAREEGVRVNIDTNGYYGPMQHTIITGKLALLCNISKLIDCISVDIKWVDWPWIRHLKDILDTAKLFKKARFRMVAYNGRGMGSDDGIEEMARQGITNVKLVPNSCGGRGSDFGPTDKEMIDSMVRYYGDRGVRLHT